MPGPPDANLLLACAQAIKDVVLPAMGSVKYAEITGRAALGDSQFALDELAEEALKRFVQNREIPLAYYSEDKGLVGHPDADIALIVDPVDGTRPAAVGFESCVVSVAATQNLADPVLSDICAACVLELKADRAFLWDSFSGVRIQDRGSTRPPSLRPLRPLERCAVSFEVVGRPLEIITPYLAPIINTCGIEGGAFLFNSTAFSLTRLVSGQLDACVDVGARALSDVFGARARFLEVGQGRILSLQSYDIAAAVPIAAACGCVVTDAWGEPLDGEPLFSKCEDSGLSICAATNADLHKTLLSLWQ